QASQVKYATVGSRDPKPGKRTQGTQRRGSAEFSLSEFAAELQKSSTASDAISLGGSTKAHPITSASDTGSMRRIRSGGRLREMAAPLKLTFDNATRTYSPQKHRHTDAASIHSLTLSTPTRASFGAKSGRAAESKTAYAGRLAGADTPRAAMTPLDATAASASHHTYLYSRVGSSITLVSILVETDKSKSRRAEANRAWLEMVDHLRGTPLFERLMSLPA
ncbi:hypothetical protein FBU59_006313, partial [Linderina macrospora]